MSDKPNQRDPREFPWGIYAYDTPGIGNTGMFDWHSTMQDSADHVEWLIDQYIEDEGWGSTKKAAARRILDAVRSTELSIDEAVDQLNREFEDLVQIAWWGKFEDLVWGDEEFPRRVRERIRVSNWDEEGFDPSPIEDDQIEEFISAVQSYGY